MTSSLRRLIQGCSVLGWSRLWWLPITPLELRLSLRRLLFGSKRPFRLFFGLLQPFPWYFEVPQNQLTPFELKDDPKVLLIRQDGIFQLRCLPLFEMRDTPLRSVYRIYEYMCAGYHTQVQYETEYFYFHPHTARWSLERIPDPQDRNEQRYAFIASIIEALAAAFNWRLSLGLQRDHSRLSFEEMDASPPLKVLPPDWTSTVPPLRETLIIAENPIRRKTPFVARNILGANNGHMYTI